jgi:hypothetical protein
LAASSGRLDVDVVPAAADGAGFGLCSVLYSGMYLSDHLSLAIRRQATDLAWDASSGTQT